MTPADVLLTLEEALADIAPEARLDLIDPDGPFREELDIDSMDFLNLIVAIKGKLGVEVPEADYGKLSTLNRIVAYLAVKVPA